MPDDPVPKAPPGEPPTKLKADEEASRKRRRGVEGLASSKHIKHGGSVTVYNGYDSVTAKPVAQASSQAATAAKPAKVEVKGLPDGWEKKVSRSTGKTYYVNEKLGKSQFEPPGVPAGIKETPKKAKVSTRPKDAPEAQFTDKNGVMGLIRASDKKLGRWQKWQKCNAILNAEEAE